MANATVFIKGENQLTPAVQSAAKDLHSLTDTAKSITKTFSTAFGIGSAVAIIKKVTQVTKNYLSTVTDPELKNAVSNISSSWADIKTHMSDLVSYSLKPLFSQFDKGFSGIKNNIKNVGNYGIAIIKNFPEVAKASAKIISNLLVQTFQWDTFKTLFLAFARNVVTVGNYAIKAIFDSIPTFLWNLMKGLGSYFAMIGINLTASLLEAVENFLNSAKDKVAVSWFGKLFKVENWSEVDFGSSKLRDTADSLQKTASAAFTTATGAAVELFNDSVSTFKSVRYEVSNAVDTLYGQIFRDGWAEIKEIIEPTLEEITDYLDESASNRANSSTSVTAEKATKLSQLLEDMVVPVSDLITLAKDLIGGIDPINEILASFYETLGAMVKETIQPLHDVLSWIGSTLAKTLAPVLEVVGSWISIISNVLSTVLGPVLQVIGAIFTALSGVLVLLTPIIQLVTEAIVKAIAPIQYVADLLSWLGAWVRYCGECVGVFIYNLTHVKDKSYGTSPGKFTSTAISGVDDRISGLYTTGGTSASTATSSASYQGATHVTINIYQEAPVVGDGGMRAFASMIKDEFDALSYYGVGA